MNLFTIIVTIVIVIILLFIFRKDILKFLRNYIPGKAMAFRLKIIMPNGQEKYLKQGDKFIMRRGDVFDAYLEPVDVNGEPTTVDGEARWTNSDDSICTIEVDPEDSLHIVGTCHQNFGSSVIEARADGDLDEGEGQVTEIVATGVCTVVGNDAVSAGLRFEVRQQPKPEEKPEEGE